MIRDFLTFLKLTDGFTMGDVIGWVVAAVGAYIVFRLIDNMQTSMARHQMLHEIENDFSEIYNSCIAIRNKETVMVRSVLHDDTPWEIITLEDGRIEFMIKDGQRYVHIRKEVASNVKSSDEWISTQALHEIVLLSKRIEKMYKNKIIKRIDLADMYHELIPLATSGRLEFFEKYYGNYDADCIGYLLMQTLVSCYKCKNEQAILGFKTYMKDKKSDFPYIKHFCNSCRTRRIKDVYAVNTFKKILEIEN